jgi:apolipoprotein N-acyltransferase
MIDETKLRLFAAAVGVLFGLGGVLALFVGITIALAEVMGLAAAAFTVAGIGLLLAAICLFLLPSAIPVHGRRSGGGRRCERRCAG